MYFFIQIPGMGTQVLDIQDLEEEDFSVVVVVDAD
jgi:hypothetical protein